MVQLEFFIDSPSCRTLSLGSTQSVTQMTNSCLLGEGGGGAGWLEQQQPLEQVAYSIDTEPCPRIVLSASTQKPDGFSYQFFEYGVRAACDVDT